LAEKSSRDLRAGDRASCEIRVREVAAIGTRREERKERVGPEWRDGVEWSVGGMGRANGATGVECARFYDGASERASERFDAEGALGRYHYANP